MQRVELNSLVSKSFNFRFQFVKSQELLNLKIFTIIAEILDENIALQIK